MLLYKHIFISGNISLIETDFDDTIPDSGTTELLTGCCSVLVYTVSTVSTYAMETVDDPFTNWLKLEDEEHFQFPVEELNLFSSVSVCHV